MAKKDFKKGLGSLIQDTRKTTENQTSSSNELSSDKENLSLEELQDLLVQQSRELHWWRTGKMTLDSFHRTLKENNLLYDAQNNELKIIE